MVSLVVWSVVESITCSRSNSWHEVSYVLLWLYRRCAAASWPAPSSWTGTFRSGQRGSPAPPMT